MEKIIVSFFIIFILSIFIFTGFSYLQKQGTVIVSSGDDVVSPLVFDEPKKDTISLEGMDEEITSQYVHSDLGYKLKFDASLFKVTREGDKDVYSLIDSSDTIKFTIEKNNNISYPDAYATLPIVGDNLDIVANIFLNKDLSQDMIYAMQEGYIARVYIMLDTIELEE